MMYEDIRTVPVSSFYNFNKKRANYPDSCVKMEQGGSDYEEIMDKIDEIQPCSCSFGRHDIAVCL